MKFGLLTREQVTDANVCPRKSGLLTRNQTFMINNCFPDPENVPLPLQISAILNKNKTFSFP